MTIRNLAGGRIFHRSLFLAWCVAVTIPSVALLASHLAALPAARVSAQRETGQWEVHHFLGEDCGCSSSVADTLLSRGPQKDVAERITFIGESNLLTGQLVRRGFLVECMTAEKAAGEGLRGAPWLLIFDPHGQLAYSGGYAQVRPRAGIAAMDLAILAGLKQGENVSPLPSFGCATSAALRRQLDPFGLKYRPVKNPTQK